MTLTDQQKLEMTETIARACGWETERFRTRLDVKKGSAWTHLNIFDDWNDAMRAADALGNCDVNITLYDDWSAVVDTNEGPDICREEVGPDRLTAFCLALHEIAKAKLEGEE